MLKGVPPTPYKVVNQLMAPVNGMKRLTLAGETIWLSV